MSKIEIKNLSFSYDGQLTPLFTEANLNIDSSWKLGLIGRNGRGKTTLLRLLQGELSYSGKVTHQLDFTYFPQTVENPHQLTFYALSELADFEQWELERELNLLEVDLDCLWREFETLSGGEQTKVLLALLFLNPDLFPLIDEPTNHLDVKGRRQVAAYLKRKKQGFIVISHDRHFIDETVDHLISIEKNQLVLYQGNYSLYENEKQQRDHFELSENQKLQKEISRLKKTAKDKADWSMSRESDIHGNPHIKGSGGIGHDGKITARAARVMKRSKAIEKRAESQIEEKEKLLKNIEFIDPLKMLYIPHHQQLLFQVENLQLFYGKNPLFKPVSFTLKQGERLALVAPNGVGKSSLLQALLGEFKGRVAGEIIRPKSIDISFVRQIYKDNQGALQDFATAHQLDYETFLSNLKKLGMERETFTNRIENMSLGQQKKVELAKSLSLKSQLYVWDEALNYLDVYNHQQLEELILNVQPTMLIVDHDETFIEKINGKKVYLERY